MADERHNNKVSEAVIEAKRLHLEFAFYERVDLHNRQICLSEDIEEDSFAFINAALTELESTSNEPITLMINSFGGSYYEALAIVGRMHRSSCKIVTEGYGKMMSAAFLLLAAGHRRRVSTYAWGMFHTISSAQGHAPAHYIHSESKQLMIEVKQMCEILSKLTKKSKRFWYKLTTKPDTFLSPEKLLEYGVVDEIF